MTAALFLSAVSAAIGYALGVVTGFKLWRQSYDRVTLIQNTRRGWLR